MPVSAAIICLRRVGSGAADRSLAGLCIIRDARPTCPQPPRASLGSPFSFTRAAVQFHARRRPVFQFAADVGVALDGHAAGRCARAKLDDVFRPGDGLFRHEHRRVLRAGGHLARSRVRDGVAA